MKQRILEYIRKRLFAGEYAKLELARRTVNDKSINEQIQLLTRANLATFDHRLLDSDQDILVVVAEEDESDEEFLKQIVDLSKNDSLTRLVAWLKREQIAYTAKEAQGIDTLNFSRGSINGLVLLQEEIDRLVGVYHERTSHRSEEYDDHSII